MNVNAAKNDINTVMKQYKGLQFAQQKFGESFTRDAPSIQQSNPWHYSYLHIGWCLTVFNDGSTKDLVNLNGTIPIVYRSEYDCV